MEQYSQVAARISVDEKKLLQQYCREHDETMSQVIRKAIREFIIDHWEDD